MTDRSRGGCHGRDRRVLRVWLGFPDAIAELVAQARLAPSFAIMVIFVYGFIAFTIYLSFTDSRMLPSYGWVGWQNYDRLFRSASGTRRSTTSRSSHRSTSSSAPSSA
jgi:ABC-type sugar transport system permease subunit